MRKMNFGLGRASLLSFLGVTGMSILTANAVVVPLGTGNNLYNTGVTVTDTALIAPGAADSHYTVTFYNTGSTVLASPPATYVATDYGVPTSSGSAFAASSLSVDPYDSTENWAANTANSQWIAYSNPVASEPNTPYDQVSVYQLVLTGIPVGDLITIAGAVAADDDVTIYGNGTQIFSDYTGGENGANNKANYNTLTNFTATTTFASAGLEGTDLDFVVYNTGGYTSGLQLQLNGSYVAAAVPEPSTYALLGVGLLGLLVWGRVRREQV